MVSASGPKPNGPWVRVSVIAIMSPWTDNQPVLISQRFISRFHHTREVVDRPDEPVIPTRQLTCGDVDLVVNLRKCPELFVLFPEIRFEERGQGGKKIAREFIQRQIPDPLSAFHFVPLDIGFLLGFGSKLVPRPATRVDRHLVGPLKAPPCFKYTKVQVKQPRRHAARK